MEDSAWQAGITFSSLDFATCSTHNSEGATDLTCDGHSEELVRYCMDSSSVQKENRAPMLTNRLTGAASLHKHMLERERPMDAEGGVEYFLDVHRPFFVR
eukprot:8226242-Prorocentrum_lima.AAC.1